MQNQYAPAQRASRYQPARRALIFWCLFVGLGAVGGAAGMLMAPDGSLMDMQGLLPYFQVLPLAELLYQDFVFPGIALLCVNGIPNLAAAALLIKKKRAGVVLGGVLGITLMAWICIQFYIFPMNFMSTAYFIFGLCQAATGYAAWVFEAQERFAAQTPAYPHIGDNPRRLVVYFSRMGYVKRLALEAAERTGAQVYAIQATERTQGTLGFWWCGRFGMHRWAMPIAPLTVDLSAYDHVTICSPIWVFHLAGPVRAFCQAARGQIKAADYVLVHFQRCGYAGAAREMDQLLGLKDSPVTSVCCRRGRIVEKRALSGAESQVSA